mgnify:CR=1 FL=1
MGLLAACLALAGCSSRKDSLNIGNFQALDAQFWTVVSKDASADRIGMDFEFTEGPAWHPGGFLIFSDIPADRIYRWEGRIFSVYRDPSRNANGLFVTDAGNLIACEHGSRSVTITSPEDSLLLRADRYNGKRLNSPNDLCMASDGTIYFTDPPYGLPETQHGSSREIPFNGVFRLKDGEVSLVDSTLSWPNGIALSPDERYLYVANYETEPLGDGDNRQVFWMRYTLDEKGRAGEREVFFTAPDPSLPGGPDGMKVDKNGNLFITGPGGILVVDPAGKHLGTIGLPLAPSNLAFGTRGKELFVTARTDVYRIQLR